MVFVIAHGMGVTQDPTHYLEKGKSGIDMAWIKNGTTAGLLLQLVRNFPFTEVSAPHGTCHLHFLQLSELVLLADVHPRRPARVALHCRHPQQSLRLQPRLRHRPDGGEVTTLLPHVALCSITLYHSIVHPITMALHPHNFSQLHPISAHWFKGSYRTLLSGKLSIIIRIAPSFQHISAILCSLTGYVTGHLKPL